MRIEFIKNCDLFRSYGAGIKVFRLLVGALLLAGPLSAGSPTGDVVGKVTVGYQGWFACANDGSPENRWIHWGMKNGSNPVPGSVSFDLYPDVREYPTTYQTGLGNLGNGSKAKVFSSHDTAVVNKHFEWMRDYGIDTVALQRFGSTLGDSRSRNQKNGIATMVKNAAQTYGRKFYIMYDLSDWTSFQTSIKSDWTNTITGSLNLLNSSAYAQQNGKPVVCIWGVGSQAGSDASWTDVINWFKAQGCYVIIGVPRRWRTDDVSSSYQYADMISPWTIGAYKTDTEIDSHGTRMKDDKALCDSLGQDYQPIVWPGFSWANWKVNEDGSIPPKNSTPRRHGDFMWRQFYQVRNQNIPSVYVAMFDEYDEGTAIAKAAENASMIPTNQWFLTLDYDGTACSADFYLRLTGDGGNMVKGSTDKVTLHPTSHEVSETDRCHIDTPAGNVTQNTGETLYVKISGTDSNGIERVKIFTNGTEVASDSVSPYEFNLLFPTAGTFTLTASVKDLLGNHTPSDNSITVTVSEVSTGPVIMAVDFQPSAGDPVPLTPDYFTGWTVGNVNAGVAAPSTNINGCAVTMGTGSSIGCLTNPALQTGMNSRSRASGYISNAGAFTQADLMRERIASLVSQTDPATGFGTGNGIYLKISGLAPNTPHFLQVWGADSEGSTPSSTLKNGYNYGFNATDEAAGYTSLPQLGTYTVAGSPATITDNNAYSISATITTDANGTLVYKQISSIDKSVMNGFALYAALVTGSTGYDIWAASNSVSGTAIVDDDGDGRNNLYEYALYGDPTDDQDHGVAPRFVVTGAGLEYVHLQRRGDANLFYTVETRTNLVSGAWTVTGYSVQSTNSYNTDYDAVTYSIATTNETSYIRLKIELP